MIETRTKWYRLLGYSIIATGVIAVLCYRSWWTWLLFPFVLYFFWRKELREQADSQKDQMKKAFLHAMTVLNDSLQAGLSMENGWREVEKELKIMYGSSAPLYLEIKEMNQRVAHNIPIEKLFMEISYKYQIEDMMQFAQLLEYGKRSGSNWKRIIQICVSRMSEKFEVKQQIEVMLAEKKTEQQIMNIMPLFILAFLQISAWDYMSVLYHNWFGVCCMSGFLIAYFVSFLISEKIMRIEV